MPIWVLKIHKIQEKANLLEGFDVPMVFVPQLLIMLIVDFSEILSAWLLSSRTISLIRDGGR